jgi:Fe-S-cluster containining protein
MSEPGDVHFDCTQCGMCCRNIRIPLTAAEAARWAEDGNQVQILCEAATWNGETPAADRRAAHFERRSFAVTSGSMPVRVVVLLVANLQGNCPNLLPDLRCGIYERRPLVCRIYPAEINPVVALDTARKSCPPEAWAPHHPLLVRGGQVMNLRIRREIDQYRESDAGDVPVRRALCDDLRLTDAAVAEEGYVVYTPPAADLLAGLGRAMRREPAPDGGRWRLVTDRHETVASLTRQGAHACHSATLECPASPGSPSPRYISLKPRQP